LLESDDAYQEAEKRICQNREDRASKLDLSGLGLTVIPDSISQLSHLRLLDASQNKISEISTKIIKLTDLYTLDLSRNLITIIPPYIESLKELHHLNVSENKIEKIPIEIGRIVNLNTLNISGNKISEISFDFFNLFHLKAFSADRNQMVKIPNGIGRLKKLRYISFLGNFIYDIPLEIVELSRLMFFSIEKKLLYPELKAAYAGGINTLFQYLKEETSKLYEAKLIFVGEGAVGKSSLLAKLRGEEWMENRDTTHGNTSRLRTASD
jgi:internalin A